MILGYVLRRERERERERENESGLSESHCFKMC